MVKKLLCRAVLVAACCLAVRLYALGGLSAEAPARGGFAAEEFAFAVAGDTHVESGAQQPVVFSRIIDAVNNSAAEFLVHLGDRVSAYSGAEVFRKNCEEYARIVKQLDVPVYHAPGNHEMAGVRGFEKSYREVFGAPYHAFTHGNVLFLVLDTESADSAGAVTGTQLSWLKKQLEEGRDYAHIFVFMHRPLFSALSPRKSHLHFRSERERDELASLFREHGVSAVFAGHEHLFQAGRHAGLLQVISGGGGGRLHFYPRGGFHHYLLVEVSADKAVIRAVPVR